MQPIKLRQSRLCTHLTDWNTDKSGLSGLMSSTPFFRTDSPPLSHSFRDRAASCRMRLSISLLIVAILALAGGVCAGDDYWRGLAELANLADNDERVMHFRTTGELAQTWGSRPDRVELEKSDLVLTPPCPQSRGPHRVPLTRPPTSLRNRSRAVQLTSKGLARRFEFRRALLFRVKLLLLHACPSRIANRSWGALLSCRPLIKGI